MVSNTDNRIDDESLINYAKTLDVIKSSLKRGRYIEDDISKATKQVASTKLVVSQCIDNENANVEKLKLDLDSFDNLIFESHCHNEMCISLMIHRMGSLKVQNKLIK